MVGREQPARAGGQHDHRRRLVADVGGEDRLELVRPPEIAQDPLEDDRPGRDRLPVEEPVLGRRRAEDEGARPVGDGVRAVGREHGVGRLQREPLDADELALVGLARGGHLGEGEPGRGRERVPAREDLEEGRLDLEEPVERRERAGHADRVALGDVAGLDGRAERPGRLEDGDPGGRVLEPGEPALGPRHDAVDGHERSVGPRARLGDEDGLRRDDVGDGPLDERRVQQERVDVALAERDLVGADDLGGVGRVERVPRRERVLLEQQEALVRDGLVDREEVDGRPGRVPLVDLAGLEDPRGRLAPRVDVVGGDGRLGLGEAVPRLGLDVGDLAVGLVRAGRVHVVLGREQVVEVAPAGLVGGPLRLGPRVLGVDAVGGEVGARVDAVGEDDGEPGVDADDGAVGLPVDLAVHHVAAEAVAERLGGRVGGPDGGAEVGPGEAGEERAADADDGRGRRRVRPVGDGDGDRVDAGRGGGPREDAGRGIDGSPGRPVLQRVGEHVRLGVLRVVVEGERGPGVEERVGGGDGEGRSTTRRAGDSEGGRGLRLGGAVRDSHHDGEGEPGVGRRGRPRERARHRVERGRGRAVSEREGERVAVGVGGLVGEGERHADIDGLIGERGCEGRGRVAGAAAGGRVGAEAVEGVGGEPVVEHGRVEGVARIHVARAGGGLAAERVVGRGREARAPLGAGVEPDLADDVEDGRPPAEDDGVVAVEPPGPVGLVGGGQDGRVR